MMKFFKKTVFYSALLGVVASTSAFAGVTNVLGDRVHDTGSGGTVSVINCKVSTNICYSIKTSGGIIGDHTGADIFLPNDATLTSGVGYLNVRLNVRLLNYGPETETTIITGPETTQISTYQEFIDAGNNNQED